MRARGRRPSEDDYILRGIAFCVCGAPMYCTRKYHGGERSYVCRDKVQSNGLCDRWPVRADILETHVLNHLEVFIGSVETWLRGQIDEHNVEQRRRDEAIERQRAALAKVDASRAKLFAEYLRHVEEGSRLAHLALEAVERIDADREAQERTIAEAEAVAAEWSGSPDMNAALDYYNLIVEALQGRVKKAGGVIELGQALAAALNGLWVEFEQDRRRLLVQFALRDDPQAERRYWLPPASTDYRPVEPPELTTTPTSASRSSRGRRGRPARRGRVARS